MYKTNSVSAVTHSGIDVTTTLITLCLEKVVMRQNNSKARIAKMMAVGKFGTGRMVRGTDEVAEWWLPCSRYL